NTRDGLHIASLAGAWIVAVAGFGGLRDHGEVLSFKPRLPPQLARLAFRLYYRGRYLRVEVTPTEAGYSLAGGDELVVAHYGEQVKVAPGPAVTKAIPPIAPRDPPRQPPGREPERRDRPS